MSRDRIIGALLLGGGLLGIIIYGMLLFLSAWSLLVLQLTAFIAVVALLLIIAWIGFTMTTTPSPKPVEEIEQELQKQEAKVS